MVETQAGSLDNIKVPRILNGTGSTMPDFMCRVITKTYIVFVLVNPCWLDVCTFISESEAISFIFLYLWRGLSVIICAECDYSSAPEILLNETY